MEKKRCVAVLFCIMVSYIPLMPAAGGISSSQISLSSGGIISYSPSPSPSPTPNPQNLAPIPNGWDYRFTHQRGLNFPGYSQYFHYPVTWQGKTCIKLDRNPEVVSHGWPSISEINSYYLSIKPGDRIVFKVALWAGPSTTGDDDWLAGASCGLDFYGSNGRICEINTPMGKESWTPTGGFPNEREQCWTPWGTTQWKYVTIDFTVKNSYCADYDAAGYTSGQMVTPTAFIPWVHSISRNVATEQGSIYFTDTELYIIP